jgi:23S rRNA (cytosine1962-C5)-methyltransferase
MQAPAGYELLDVGGGARLERFGTRIVDRPHPGALGARLDPDAWSAADLRFDRDSGWTGPAAPLGSWPIEVVGLTLKLRPTDAGQVGLFPEHLAVVPWLRDQVRALAVASGRTTSGAAPAPAALHLFAYTGVATLAMAAAGASVTHVDSSRPTVGWARRNSEASGLGDRPVRWIVDDALAFAEREVRRGRRYDGLVLDPPTYGHGPAGRPWQLVEELPTLLGTCAELLEPDGFVLLTAHTPGVDGDRLATMLAGAISRPAPGVERGELFVETSGGRGRLELGAFACLPAGAS